MPQSKIKRILGDYNMRRYIILAGILVLMLLGFSTQSKVYVTIENFTNVANKYTEIGILSAGMTLIILTGDIDLSVGSVMCFAAYTCGILMQNNVPVPVAVAVALIASTLIGLFNGFMIAKLKMQSIIVTLGTMTFIRGLCYVFKAGGNMRGFPDESFYAFGSGRLFGFIPYSFVLLCVLFLILSLVFRKTRLGMDIKAIGNNASAAGFSGINVSNYKMGLFSFNGFVSGLAGVIILSRMQGIEASLGTGYEFDAITMCLLGGISIQGGKGTLLGTFMGIIVIAYLKSGMNFAQISAYYQSAILGLIILLSVVVGNLESGKTRQKK